MEYWYNTITGYVQEWVSGLPFPAQLAAPGWHGPFKTRADVDNFYNQNKAAHPEWNAPGTSISGFVQNIPNQASAAIGADVKSAVGDTIGNFNLASWFLRVGEIVLGIVLVGVGIAKLTGTTNFVMEAVKKVPV